ncbi:MAG: hypothetical protein WC496_03335 [Phycisphaerae bacterium]|jgi:hypothetical protein
MKIIKECLLILLIVILVLVSIFFYMTRGQPKVTIDYTAEYNKISQPANYDPNQNAAELYQAAYENLIQKPKQLQRGDAAYAEWPTDFNIVEDEIIKKWLTENEKSLQIFRMASLKPYLWIEASSADGMISIKYPEWTYLFYDLIEAVLWDAKTNAAKGEYARAIEDISACCRLSFQRCNNSPVFLMSMYNSLRQRQKAMYTAMLILKKSKITESATISFQQDIERITDTHSCVFDFSAEIMLLHDVVQRTYVYKPDESGLLAWKKKSDYYTLCDTGPWPIIKSCFVGPTQKEVKKQINSYYDQLTAAYTLTPWQLHQEKPDFFDKLFLGCQPGTLVLYVYGSDFAGVYYDYYDTEAQYQALLTTIAVLRFNRDKGRLPNNLDELVQTEYLKKLPVDPYSNKPLIYKVEADDFKIYSVGKNFTDEGGEGSFYPSWIGTSGLPQDLVYWPPIDLMRVYQNRKRLYSEPNQP